MDVAPAFDDPDEDELTSRASSPAEDVAAAAALSAKNIRMTEYTAGAGAVWRRRHIPCSEAHSDAAAFWSSRSC